MRVLLGIGGGIAAYKAAELVRLLRGDGHEVRCCPTRHATAFVAPLTLEVLSGRPLLTEAYLEPGTGGREEHIDAAAWTDVLCVAPATADLLARLSLGIAGDVLTTTALAVAGPWIVAPAMHGRMWAQPQVQEHVERCEPGGPDSFGRVRRLARARALGRCRTGRSPPRSRPPSGPGHCRPPIWSRRPTYDRSIPSVSREPVERPMGSRSPPKPRAALRVTLIAGLVALPTPGGSAVDVETARRCAIDAAAAGKADAVVMGRPVADFRPRRSRP